jgi:hypothetical protein
MKSLTPSRRALQAVCLALPVVFAASAHAVTIHTADFEPGPLVGYSGAGIITPTEGYAAFGFGTGYLRNDTAGSPAASTVLTLGSLPAHSSVTLSFDLAVIDSWDGNAGGVGPDIFNVRINGVLAFSETFTNLAASHGFTQSYAGAPFVSATGGNLAQNSGWQDSAYALSLTVPDTASGLTIEWFASGSGWQAGIDESWAVDNVRVDVAASAVPEGGSTLALMGLVMAGLGMAHARAGKRNRR